MALDLELSTVDVGRLMGRLARLAGMDDGDRAAGALVGAIGAGPDGQPPVFEATVTGPPALVRSALSLAALWWVLLERKRVLWWAPSQRALADAAAHVHRLVEAAPELRRHVERITRTAGLQTLQAFGDGRLMFRTGMGARGIAADKLIVDTPRAGLAPADWASLIPCVAGRANPQVLFGEPG